MGGKKGIVVKKNGDRKIAYNYWNGFLFLNQFQLINVKFAFHITLHIHYDKERCFATNLAT